MKKSSSSPVFSTPITQWLLIIMVSIILMASIGAITRITGSGLSIVDWRPIMGVIPPLNELEWIKAFEAYQQIPQYKALNSSMTLSEFKFIYFWEWFHRLFGRIIGVLVLIPLVYFYFTRTLPKRTLGFILLGFALGGLQGFLGWFMVQSGLLSGNYVSHVRLCIHLLMAMLILAYFCWIRLDYIHQFKPDKGTLIPTPKSASLYKKISFLFILQFIYGAFVAGLKAGYQFNTFPLMLGEWIPSTFWMMEPLPLNLSHNPATVQWIHRTLGIVLFIGVILFNRTLKKEVTLSTHPLLKLSKILLAITHLQVILGVLTLLTVVSLPLAALHQSLAFVLVVVLTYIAYYLRRYGTKN